MPRDGNVDKKEETELLWSNVVESQSAFLGPNLWDNKTMPYDNDLKVNFDHLGTNFFMNKLEGATRLSPQMYTQPSLILLEKLYVPLRVSHVLPIC